MSEQRVRRRKDKCSSRIRMVAEDEVMVAEEIGMAHLTKGIQTFCKRTEALEEPSEEGGASMPNKVGKQCHLPATIVGRSTTAKRSAERKEVSRLPQAGNSQTMPPTPILKIWWIVRHAT